MVIVGTTHAAVDKSFTVILFGHSKVTPETINWFNIVNVLYII